MEKKSRRLFNQCKQWWERRENKKDTHQETERKRDVQSEAHEVLLQVFFSSSSLIDFFFLTLHLTHLLQSHTTIIFTVLFSLLLTLVEKRDSRQRLTSGLTANNETYLNRIPSQDCFFSCFRTCLRLSHKRGREEPHPLSEQEAA